MITIAATVAKIPSTRISPPTAIPTLLVHVHVHDDSDDDNYFACSPNSHYNDNVLM